MGRKKKAPQIRIPEIKQLPSGSWHTRVMVDGKRIAITKPTYDECVAEYLAIKKGVVQAKEKGPQRSKTLEETLTDYINARRIEAAQKILETTELSIGSVAEQTGFASAAHFRRVFRETMGVGPLQYRKSRK